MKKFNFNSILPFFTILLIIFSSCRGYVLGPQKSDKIADVNSIYVPTFINETLEPRLSTLFASATVKKLQEDGTFKIKSKKNADAILLAKIKGIARSQLTSSRQNILSTERLRLIVEVKFSLVDRITKRVLLSSTVRPEAKVYLDKNQQLTERTAMSLIADDCADRINLYISEEW